jgi:hypothetical protein
MAHVTTGDDITGILACAPDQAGLPASPVPTTLRECDRCRQAGRDTPIRVGTAMVDKVDSGALRAVCAPCATDLVVANSTDVEFGLAPQQAAQLVELGILGDSDWRLTQLNRAARRLRRNRGTAT